MTAAESGEVDRGIGLARNPRGRGPPWASVRSRSVWASGFTAPSIPPGGVGCQPPGRHPAPPPPWGPVCARGTPCPPTGAPGPPPLQGRRAGDVGRGGGPRPDRGREAAAPAPSPGGVTLSPVAAPCSRGRVPCPRIHGRANSSRVQPPAETDPASSRTVHRLVGRYTPSSRATRRGAVPRWAQVQPHRGPSSGPWPVHGYLCPPAPTRADRQAGSPRYYP